MCWMRFAGNAGPKKSPKIHHLGTIAEFCRAMSSQLRHILTIGRKLVKQQCLPHMSSQCGEFRPTSGWDMLARLGHPSKFQRVSCLGSITARHSSSGRQPNLAALNRGRHLYSARQPSRWALAHILVCHFGTLLFTFVVLGFSTKQRDWLERMSPKWPSLRRVTGIDIKA